MLRRALFVCVLASLSSFAKETFRNEKVAVTEITLHPGESDAGGQSPCLVIYKEAGAAGRKKGEVEFRAAGGSPLTNAGKSDLAVVRIDFLGSGEPGSKWGTSGLSPHYVLLLENQYLRAYDIKIPAGTQEPQHTHKNRVVVCLSGATLMHIWADGTKETADLKTGVVAWRKGGTHVGMNLGKTDLWVIAVEPK